MLKLILWSVVIAAQVSCGSNSKPAKTETPDGIVDGFALSKTKLFQVKALWDLPLKAAGNGENSVQLTFLDLKGSPIKSVTILEFHPRMPMMGHGTDESTQVFTQDRDEDNVFRISGIYFNMAGNEGEWVATLKASVDSKVDSLQLSVPNVE